MHLYCGNHAGRCLSPGKVCTVVPASGSRSSIGDRPIARHRNGRPPPHILTPRLESELRSGGWLAGLDSRLAGTVARQQMAPDPRPACRPGRGPHHRRHRRGHRGLPIIRAIWRWTPKTALIGGRVVGWIELADHATLLSAHCRRRHHGTHAGAAGPAGSGASPG
jgi:hypothetical protein